jgi:hypothetical protein
MLNLRVPENKTGSCGMMVSFDRSDPSPIFAMSMPSMTIDPPTDSRIRNRARVSDDFPAPVRPTIPIFSPATMLKETPLRTSSRPSRYRVW